MGTDNAYAELGLSPGASEKEVKKAWRRLASMWHPDRNPSASASAKMQRINQAVALIRRSGFGDLPGATPPGDPATGDGAPVRQPGKPAREHDDRRPPPRTIVREVELSLEDAAHGCVRSVQGQLTDPCGQCLGSGMGAPVACAACLGAGTVRQGTWYTWFGVDSECAACGGSGSLAQECGTCDGSGESPARAYRVDVRIPRGVRDGDVLHASEPKPADGQAELRFDLRIGLLPHPLFGLSDDGTVRCEMPVDGFAWVANRSIEVPTLDGLRPVKLNREQSTYRLEGLGFPVERRGAKRGDQVVQLRPMFPAQLSADQNILLDQLIASLAKNQNSEAARSLAAWRQAVKAWRAGLNG